MSAAAHEVWVGSGGCPSTHPDSEGKIWCNDRIGHAGLHHARNKNLDPTKPIGVDNPPQLEWR